MEVIGAGFGRTGTSSLRVALERLGFGPCYHMQELLENPGHAGFWGTTVERRGDTDWRGFFKDYGSAVDWPACSFYEELMATYPQAKVILTVRDPEKWHRSALDTIYAISNSRSSRFFFAVVGPFSPLFREMGRITDALIWSGTFHGRFEDRDYAIRIFEEHIREVERTVPPEKLLVFDVKQGWGPLCDFLGVEQEPEEPFPHLNDTRTFRRMVWLQRAFAAVVPLAFAVTLATLLRRYAR